MPAADIGNRSRRKLKRRLAGRWLEPCQSARSTVQRVRGRPSSRVTVPMRHAERSPTRSSARTAERSCERRLLRRFVIRHLLLLLFLCASAASAQVDMPDPRAIAGTPLPAPELPNAHRHRARRARADGQQHRRPGGDAQVGAARRTAKTDEQGRAQFDGLTAGTPVQATTTSMAKTLTSQEFPVPGTGGVRVALISGIAAAAAKEKAAADAAAKEPARPGVVEIGPESRIIIEYPGRQPHGVLPARDRQQRAHADRHRRTAADSSCRPAPRVRR